MSNEETKNEETKVEATAKEAKAPRGKKPAQRGGGRKNNNNNQDPAAMEFEERVVAVNRVAKVVKGGRRFSFSALMIAGDKKGRVGYGLGKAKEVPDAIKKASQEAKTKLINVPIEKGTIPHTILGEFDAAKILFKPAGEGTGIKAAGACRSILELAGLTNVLTKSTRGTNPHNVVKATFVALKGLRSTEQVAKARGVDPKTVRI